MNALPTSRRFLTRKHLGFLCLILISVFLYLTYQPPPRWKPRFGNLRINLPATPLPTYNNTPTNIPTPAPTLPVIDGSDIDVFPKVSQWDKASYDIPSTKFLSYVPHSGFHNQRIELENALTLSRLLNRTLLISNFRLGLAGMCVLLCILYPRFSSFNYLIKYQYRGALVKNCRQP